MITMRMIQKVSLALPNTHLKSPDDTGRAYIVDRNGDWVGDIDFREAVFTIYEDYEYCQQVIESLESQGEKVIDMIEELEKNGH